MVTGGAVYTEAAQRACWRGVADLAEYGVRRGLLEPEDRVDAVNLLLDALGLESFEAPERRDPPPLEEILGGLLDAACGAGACEGSPAARDRFDTRLMGCLTPRPGEVIRRFLEEYRVSPQRATDWYYQFSRDTDYIRTYRVKKDLRWNVLTEYGEMTMTINRSKPEKDPRDIAAARNRAGGYPACALCRECEGYAGRAGFPARQNHRVIPLTLAGAPWYLQYSPYVYYPEHCIVLQKEHAPMRVDRAAFDRLLDFVRQFPHYFVGSNADLPVVGGSILSHEHFQGGRYTFPMERAPVEREIPVPGRPGVAAGAVRWPMSVLRLRGADPEELAALAEQVRLAWREYRNEALGLLPETGGVPHHTLTPVARRRGADYELDLVFRSNIASAEHPLGVFHPHEELHHIKKENIGLIEVMGLAVLPARLEAELGCVEELLRAGGDLRAHPLAAPHADWAEELFARRRPAPGELPAVLRDEVGRVFQRVLACCAVFPRTPAGQGAFVSFLEKALRRP